MPYAALVALLVSALFATERLVALVFALLLRLRIDGLVHFLAITPVALDLRAPGRDGVSSNHWALGSGMRALPIRPAGLLASFSAAFCHAVRGCDYLDEEPELLVPELLEPAEPADPVELGDEVEPDEPEEAPEVLGFMLSGALRSHPPATRANSTTMGRISFFMTCSSEGRGTITMSAVRPRIGAFPNIPRNPFVLALKAIKAQEKAMNR